MTLKKRQVTNVQEMELRYARIKELSLVIDNQR